MTFVGDWAFKVNYLSMFGMADVGAWVTWGVHVFKLWIFLVCFLTNCVRPDITVMVDWALKIKYNDIYLWTWVRMGGGSLRFEPW